MSPPRRVRTPRVCDVACVAKLSIGTSWGTRVLEGGSRERKRDLGALIGPTQQMRAAAAPIVNRCQTRWPRQARAAAAAKWPTHAHSTCQSVVALKGLALPGMRWWCGSCSAANGGVARCAGVALEVPIVAAVSTDIDGNGLYLRRACAGSALCRCGSVCCMHWRASDATELPNGRPTRTAHASRSWH